MNMRQNLYMEVKDSQRITAMIDSLCSTWVADLNISIQGDPNTHTIWGPTGSRSNGDSQFNFFLYMELHEMFE